MLPFYHQPVLVQELLKALSPLPHRWYVDATLGGGGHTAAILETLISLNKGENEEAENNMNKSLELGPSGIPSFGVIGLDQDLDALTYAKTRLENYSEHLLLAHSNFSNLPEVLQSLNFKTLEGGIIADLGVSSHQLDDGTRGFSFRQDAPLDMRMNQGPSAGGRSEMVPQIFKTAAQVVNEADEAHLVYIFSTYGEERFSKTIAREMVERRKTIPFETTTDLASFVSGIHQRYLGARAFGDKRSDKRSGKKGSKEGGRGSSIHPATQVFQALRIEVNQELQHLEKFLENSVSVLSPGARLVIISFHSLEDRLVKRFFQRESVDCICPGTLPMCQCDHRKTLKIISKKPIEASPEEVAANPRARSAKLRVAERL
ncbi:MAG: 16S rRNA (cytosine(1402)-N(4))-methyltransferase [Cyanobacteria bacterium]|nr:16S rRNA (cytosine(1402)-N(4))-methyltransferase [Cyanobacteriota bacterium]